MSLLLAKIVISMCVVLGLSWVAEHVNPRIAGIISGMPLGAVLALSFVGHEQGAAYAAESALYAIPGIIATIAFAIGYYHATRLEIRLSPLVCSLVGVIAFFVATWGLQFITFDLTLGVSLALAAILLMAYVFRSSETNKIPTRVRMTIPRMLMRSGMAAGFVVAITWVADLIGPRLAGLVIGFPMTFLPFLLIIHISYSAAHVRTIIRNFPLGLIGLLVFLSVASQSILEVGVGTAITLALLSSWVYLTLLGLALRRFRPAPAK